MSVIHTQIGHVGRRGRAFRQEDKHTACHGPGAAMHASSTNTACGARRLLVKWRRGRPWTRNGECVLVRGISLCVLGPPRPRPPQKPRKHISFGTACRARCLRRPSPVKISYQPRRWRRAVCSLLPLNMLTEARRCVDVHAQSSTSLQTFVAWCHNTRSTTVYPSSNAPIPYAPNCLVKSNPEWPLPERQPWPYVKTLAEVGMRSASSHILSMVCCSSAVIGAGVKGRT